LAARLYIVRKQRYPSAAPETKGRAEIDHLGNKGRTEFMVDRDNARRGHRIRRRLKRVTARSRQVQENGHSNQN
jgi:hypothetical protein